MQGNSGGGNKLAVMRQSQDTLGNIFTSGLLGQNNLMFSYQTVAQIHLEMYLG